MLAHTYEKCVQEQFFVDFANIDIHFYRLLANFLQVIYCDHVFACF